VTRAPANTARTASNRCSTTDNATSANPGLPVLAASAERSPNRAAEHGPRQASTGTRLSSITRHRTCLAAALSGLRTCVTNCSRYVGDASGLDDVVVVTLSRSAAASATSSSRSTYRVRSDASRGRVLRRGSSLRVRTSPGPAVTVVPQLVRHGSPRFIFRSSPRRRALSYLA
jgi:hypothetical protein